MVKIRLRRMGAKKAPFYRIVVADSRSPRDVTPETDVSLRKSVTTILQRNPLLYLSTRKRLTSGSLTALSPQIQLRSFLRLLLKSNRCF